MIVAVLYERIAAELSLIRADRWTAPWTASLPFCRTEIVCPGGYRPTEDDDLLHDVLIKGLLRGDRPFTSYSTEQAVVSAYGERFGIEPDQTKDRGTIRYNYRPHVRQLYTGFSDVVAEWHGSPVDIAFDPGHPENERAFFARLVSVFGPRFAHLVTPQVEIDLVLPREHAPPFSAQRLDFLVSLPNGRGLILEPGDHDTSAEIARDRQRD